MQPGPIADIGAWLAQTRTQDQSGGMMRLLVRIVLGTAGVIALVATASIGIGRSLFERRMDEEVASLLMASTAGEPAMITEADLAGLPDPVQRWLRWAQVIGSAMPATVHLTQEGRFRLSESSAWMPFTAEESFTTEPPGFVWKTTMRLFPLVSIMGRDRYAGGKGSIDMRALGLIPVATASGPAMDQGALLRYLNETMWFPAAALSPYITWDAIDATSARATISDGGVMAAATFVFDEQGRPVDMVAERQDLARGRLETWSTPLSAYGEFAGVRVPVEGTALWRYDTGDFPYIEVRITGLEPS
jgi:hypothetical protein